MKRLFLFFASVILSGSTVFTQNTKSTSDDAAIKQAIIRESIASYAGSCPCPYNRDRAGRSCGKRSAYSKPGGASPVCYEADVTPKMVEDYKKAHPQAKSNARESTHRSSVSDGYRQQTYPHHGTHTPESTHEIL